MSLTYRISNSHAHVRVVGSGQITTEECIRLIRGLLADPHNEPTASALIDLRHATYAPRDKEEVVRIAKTLEAFHDSIHSNIAIVAKSSLLFPAEVFALHVRKTINIGIRVFVDLKAAKDYCRGRWKIA